MSIKMNFGVVQCESIALGMGKANFKYLFSHEVHWVILSYSLIC